MRNGLFAGVAAVACLVSIDARADELPPSPPPPTVAPSCAALPASPMRGWIGLQERNVWGLAPSRATDDYGVDLLGGLWLLDEQMQPIVDVGWSRVIGPPYVIDTFRAGAKVAGGWALADESVWIGAGVGFVVEAGWMHQPAMPLAGAVSPSVSFLAQARVARRVVLGADLGLERALPNLRWENGYSIFNNVRAELGVQIGIVLGDPVP